MCLGRRGLLGTRDGGLGTGVLKGTRVLVSLFAVRYSLFAVRCSLLAVRCYLLSYDYNLGSPIKAASELCSVVADWLAGSYAYGLETLGVYALLKHVSAYSFCTAE
jgi:hypothetical protein